MTTAYRLASAVLAPLALSDSTGRDRAVGRTAICRTRWRPDRPRQQRIVSRRPFARRDAAAASLQCAAQLKRRRSRAYAPTSRANGVSPDVGRAGVSCARYGRTGALTGTSHPEVLRSGGQLWR